MLVTDVGDEISWWQLFDVGDKACHEDIDVGTNILNQSPTSTGEIKMQISHQHNVSNIDGINDR